MTMEEWKNAGKKSSFMLKDTENTLLLPISAIAPADSRFAPKRLTSRAETAQPLYCLLATES